MDIQEKETLIAEIERFKEEAMKSYIVSCWAESYTNTDPFGYVVLENKNNKVWWLKTQAYQLWEMWQAAKAQAVPEWISVEDGLPSDGQDIIAFDAIKHCVFKDGEFLQGYIESDTGYEYEEPVEVTHWMAVEAREQAND